MKRTRKIVTRCIIVIALLYGIETLVNNFFPTSRMAIPVANAQYGSWSLNSFWYYPWGKSGVHKGIDIFAKRNSIVICPVNGIIVQRGYSENGGNFVYVLDAHFCLYYFAHLEKRYYSARFFVTKADTIGYVGDSGNAKFSPCHLHFSVLSLTPIVKNFDRVSPEGWKKLFYLNPNLLFGE